MVDNDKLLEWAKDITVAKVSTMSGTPDERHAKATNKYLESIYEKLVELNKDN